MPPQRNEHERQERKRAVLYLRVSTKGQVETDYDPEGISLPAQRAACTKRALELGADVVDEYVEPGRSATTVAGRPEFRKLMARIKAERDVDYVIVYNRARLHRNSIDAAITKKDLRAAGAVLISVMDYTEDTAVGDLVATVLDAVNEYQSRASGADISYKMAQKVIRGGSVGRAPIGYLNVRKKIDGREVRTVVIDPERGPLVRMAFELYATGTYGFHDLIDALTSAGLRTRPTKNHPAGKPISIARLGAMLRNRYYLGYVTHNGVEYKGRHEPLITQELFDRVQEVLDSERGGGTRARVHNHYLKGTVWCRRCSRRLIIMRGKGKRGDLYFYYICRGRQSRSCDLPYMPVAAVEEAVERHYASVALPADLRARITQAMDAAMADDATINDERRDQINKQLAKLDVQEDQYLDLVGDPDWPKAKIGERLRRIRDERARLQRQLDQLERPDLDTGRAALQMALELLARPDELYRVASKRARRVLNQALFTKLYVDADDDAGPRVTADEPTQTFAPLMDAHRAIKQNGGSTALQGNGTAVSSSALVHAALTCRCSAGGSGGRPPERHCGPPGRREGADHGGPPRRCSSSTGWVDPIASYSNTYAQLRKLRARLSTADMTTSKVGARSRP